MQRPVSVDSIMTAVVTYVTLNLFSDIAEAPEWKLGIRVVLELTKTKL